MKVTFYIYIFAVKLIFVLQTWWWIFGNSLLFVDLK